MRWRAAAGWRPSTDGSPRRRRRCGARRSDDDGRASLRGHAGASARVRRISTLGDDGRRTTTSWRVRSSIRTTRWRSPKSATASRSACSSSAIRRSGFSRSSGSTAASADPSAERCRTSRDSSQATPWIGSRRTSCGGCGLQALGFHHQGCAQRAFEPYVQRVVASPLIEVGGGWDAYLETRRDAGVSSFNALPRKMRKLERELGALRFESHTDDPSAMCSARGMEARAVRANEHSRLAHTGVERGDTPTADAAPTRRLRRDALGAVRGAAAHRGARRDAKRDTVGTTGSRRTTLTSARCRLGWC